MSKLKAVAAGSLAVILGVGQVSAQFLGIGGIVHDPINAGHLISEINQAVKAYQRLTEQYERMKKDAEYISGKGRWKTRLTQWALPGADNHYATTDGWIRATNGDGPGWYRTSVRVYGDYKRVWDKLSREQRANIAMNYASVELADGITMNSLAQAGAIRRKAIMDENALTALEQDVYDDGDDGNTFAASLNKISAAGILQVHSQQDTVKLLTAVLDQQAVAMRAQREAYAQSIENDIVAREESPAINRTHFAGATQAMREFRIP